MLVERFAVHGRSLFSCVPEYVHNIAEITESRNGVLFFRCNMTGSPVTPWGTHGASFCLCQITGDCEQGSLLARGLAAVKNSGPPQGHSGPVPTTRQRDDTFSDGESLMGDPRVDHGTDHSAGGCTVSSLLA